MKPKFKLYRTEKRIFIILLFIFILNCYPYMVGEIKMIPAKIDNRNNPLFARLELGAACCTPGRKIDSKESRDTVERYLETLGEDIKTKAEGAEEGLNVETHFNEFSSRDDLKKGCSYTYDFHDVAYGYFKEELSEHNEVQFEVLSMYRNLDIGDTDNSSGSYFWGKLAIRLFFILITIDITIRALMYIFYKINKKMASLK